MSAKEYVEQNLESILDNNPIGSDSFSKVYGFRFQDQDFALKKYHDMGRCRTEAAFLGRVSQLNLPAVPGIHARDLEKGIVVMDRMDETLRAYLERNREDRDVVRRLVNEILNGMVMLHEERIVYGASTWTIPWCRLGRCSFCLIICATNPLWPCSPWMLVSPK